MGSTHIKLFVCPVLEYPPRHVASLRACICPLLCTCMQQRFDHALRVGVAQPMQILAEQIIDTGGCRCMQGLERGEAGVGVVAQSGGDGSSEPKKMRKKVRVVHSIHIVTTRLAQKGFINQQTTHALLRCSCVSVLLQLSCSVHIAPPADEGRLGRGCRLTCVNSSHGHAQASEQERALKEFACKICSNVCHDPLSTPCGTCCCVTKRTESACIPQHRRA